ncbi:MAG: MFS transporter [Rhodopirellula sp.]|nr:MFS transporter [Rhodopirellula sp.]
MTPGRAAVRGFLGGPDLSGNSGRTYRIHLAYAMLDGTAGGILLNAPIVAIKAFEAANWHLPLRELYSGIGMIAAVYLGSWMASRRKMPFVFVPGVLAGVSTLLMAGVTDSAFAFLTMLGIGAMFENVTRPAVTTILRLNYPVQRRGHATGEARKWSSLAFVVSSLVSALLLQVASDCQQTSVADGFEGGAGALLGWTIGHMAHLLMVLAGLLSIASFLCFRQIRVEEDPHAQRHDIKPEIGRTLRDAVAVVACDRRYRRYLLGCFVDGFFQMLYLPLVWVFLSKTLGFGYVGCSALMHAIPALVAFATTGLVGKLLDRSNPWIAWACIRFIWGLDAILLAATPFVATLFPPAIVLLPVAARVLRGSVQGGWWILWWQIGVTHFAPPGGDTSRYMGIMAFLHGMIRLTASAAGMALAALAVPPATLIAVGGLGVIFSGVYSLINGLRERRVMHLETTADFEQQFLDERGAFQDRFEQAAH